MKNSTNRKITASFVCALALTVTAASASASDGFYDDFESGSLSKWTGKSFGAHDARIAVDPLDPTNHALTFDTLESAGEIFTAEMIDFNDSGIAFVNFDYLGFSRGGSSFNNYGGFAGFAAATPGEHHWTHGTLGSSTTRIDMKDNNRWHSYSFEIHQRTVFGGDAPGFFLMFEDFAGSGGVAGDVYFDNIVVNNIPTPGAGALVAMSFCLGMKRRRELA